MQVRLCLVEFHGLSELRADRAIVKFERDFPLSSEAPEVELLYHSSPFSIACEITGKNLTLKDRARRYKQILDSANTNVLTKGVLSSEVPGSLAEVFQRAFSSEVKDREADKGQLKTQAAVARRGGRVVREKVADYPARKTTPDASLKTVAAKGRAKAKKKSSSASKKTT